MSNPIASFVNPSSNTFEGDIGPFYYADELFIIGQNSSGTPRMYTSTNGGSTWSAADTAGESTVVGGFLAADIHQSSGTIGVTQSYNAADLYYHEFDCATASWTDIDNVVHSNLNTTKPHPIRMTSATNCIIASLRVDKDMGTSYRHVDIYEGHPTTSWTAYDGDDQAVNTNIYSGALTKGVASGWYHYGFTNGSSLSKAASFQSGTGAFPGDAVTLNGSTWVMSAASKPDTPNNRVYFTIDNATGIERLRENSTTNKVEADTSNRTFQDATQNGTIERTVIHVDPNDVIWVYWTDYQTSGTDNIYLEEDEATSDELINSASVTYGLHGACKYFVYNTNEFIGMIYRDSAETEVWRFDTFQIGGNTQLGNISGGTASSGKVLFNGQLATIDWRPTADGWNVDDLFTTSPLWSKIDDDPFNTGGESITGPGESGGFGANSPYYPVFGGLKADEFVSGYQKIRANQTYGSDPSTINVSNIDNYFLVGSSATDFVGTPTAGYFYHGGEMPADDAIDGVSYFGSNVEPYNSCRSGPYDYNGDIYAVFPNIDNTRQMRVIKSTNGGSTWTTQATSSDLHAVGTVDEGIMHPASQIIAWDSVISGDKIAMVTYRYIGTWGTSDPEVKYTVYDISSDTWLTAESVATTSNVMGKIAVLSDGKVIRIGRDGYFQKRPNVDGAGSWSSETDAYTASVDSVNVCAGGGGRAHVVFNDANNARAVMTIRSNDTTYTATTSDDFNNVYPVYDGTDVYHLSGSWSNYTLTVNGRIATDGDSPSYSSSTAATLYPHRGSTSSICHAGAVHSGVIYYLVRGANAADNVELITYNGSWSQQATSLAATWRLTMNPFTYSGNSYLGIFEAEGYMYAGSQTAKSRPRFKTIAL